MGHFSRSGVMLWAIVKRGKAVLSFGDGEASNSDLDGYGITKGERKLLADHYQTGDQIWRVPIHHFSPFDCNWAAFLEWFFLGPPGGADGRGPGCEQSTENGSIIGCDSQSLGEVIALDGTPVRLVYSSGRVPGRIPTIDIPLYDSTVNDRNLIAIEVAMNVAGVDYEASYKFENEVPPTVETWSWDRHDAYGRFVQGAAPAEIVVKHLYTMAYTGLSGARTSGVASVATGSSSKRRPERARSDSGPTAVGSKSRCRETSPRRVRREVVFLGGWDVAQEKLGG